MTRGVLVEFCESEDCIRLEQRCIDAYVADGIKLFNVTLTAGSTLGVKFSEEAKAKISAKARGRKQTPEHIAKATKHLKGRVHKQSTLDKMRGQTRSDNTKRNIKEAVQAWWDEKKAAQPEASPSIAPDDNGNVWFGDQNEAPNI